jgi:density-regulated protein DRP1
MAAEAEENEPSGEAQEAQKALEPNFVQYCSACTLPTEYCYLVQNHPEGVGGLREHYEGDSKSGESTGSRVKAPKAKKQHSLKKKEANEVKLTRATRGKKKCVVRVKGLELFTDTKLADCAKRLGKKFACGASLTEDAAGEPEIDVQGDLMADIAEFLESVFSVPREAIKQVDKEKSKG